MCLRWKTPQPGLTAGCCAQPQPSPLRESSQEREPGLAGEGGGGRLPLCPPRGPGSADRRRAPWRPRQRWRRHGRRAAPWPRPRKPQAPAGDGPSCHHHRLGGSSATRLLNKVISSRCTMGTSRMTSVRPSCSRGKTMTFSAGRSAWKLNQKQSVRGPPGASGAVCAHLTLPLPLPSDAEPGLGPSCGAGGEALRAGQAEERRPTEAEGGRCPSRGVTHLQGLERGTRANPHP